MSGLENTGATGTLTISGILMNCPAWDLLDLRALTMRGSRRGQNRIIPRQPGVRGKRRRPTGTPHSLPLLVSGLADAAGQAPEDCTYDGMMAQLQDNIDYLMANVCADVPTMTGTRTAVLSPLNGGTRTGQIQTFQINPGAEMQGHTMRCTLDIEVLNPEDFWA